jgi:hypothetical protein
VKSPDFLKSMPLQAAAPSIVWFGIAGTNDSSDLETPLIMTSSPYDDQHCEKFDGARSSRRSRISALRFVSGTGVLPVSAWAAQTNTTARNGM